MIQHKVSEEIIHFLSENMKNNIDKTILKRGFSYFKEGNVLAIEVEKDSVVHATVRGTKKYQIRIDTVFFAMSSCTCPFDGYCKHMAATFFALYETYGSPRKWLSEYNNHSHSGSYDKGTSILTSFKPSTSHLPLQKNKRFETFETPRENDSIIEWHQNFTRNYSKNYKIHSSHDIHSLFERIRRELLALSKYWGADKQFLYELHVHLFLLQLIIKVKNSVTASYYAWYFEREWHDEIAQSQELLFQFLKNQASQAFVVNEADSYILETVEYLHFVFKHRPTDLEYRAVNWINMYRSVWLLLLGKNSVLMQLEINYLENELQNSSDNQESITTALVFFDVFQGNDNRAMERLTQLSVFLFDAYFFTLVFHEHRNHWQQLLHWLRWFQQSIEYADKNILFLLSRFWRSVSEYTQSDAEWVDTLTHYFPDSVPQYLEYMIDTNRYKEWVDALLVYKVPLEDIQKEQLKKIEKKDPKLLLPLYHQAVEQLVQEKNRQSYKLAVRRMKTLLRFYKKLKQLDRWQLFLQAFCKKYSRLRALHEELKKGNLVG